MRKENIFIPDGMASDIEKECGDYEENISSVVDEECADFIYKLGGRKIE